MVELKPNTICDGLYCIFVLIEQNGWIETFQEEYSFFCPELF